MVIKPGSIPGREADAPSSWAVRQEKGVSVFHYDAERGQYYTTDWRAAICAAQEWVDEHVGGDARAEIIFEHDQATNRDYVVCVNACVPA